MGVANVLVVPLVALPPTVHDEAAPRALVIDGTGGTMTRHPGKTESRPDKVASHPYKADRKPGFRREDRPHQVGKANPSEDPSLTELSEEGREEDEERRQEGGRRRRRKGSGDDSGGDDGGDDGGVPAAPASDEAAGADPVDCQWDTWNDWDTCTASCGGGGQARSRTYTEAQNGGAECPGMGEETQSCNEDVCTTTTLKPVKIKLSNDAKQGLFMLFILLFIFSPMGIACWCSCLCLCACFLYQRSQNQKNQGKGAGKGYDDDY